MMHVKKQPTKKEVNNLKKAIIILLALGLLLATASVAIAKQEANDSSSHRAPFDSSPLGTYDGTSENEPAKGNIVANEYDKDDTSSDESLLNSSPGYTDDEEYLQELNSDKTGFVLQRTYTGFPDSTHPQGTWNSPYTSGIDGYNYNDPQDYTEENEYGAGLRNENNVIVEPSDIDTDTPASDNYYTKLRYSVGPHGNYLTTTHKCRECHAVHRAAGKFKLTRSDTRFEACDWCHGSGAGSGFNIQMDNDDDYTTEYNVGHTMGYGIESGKWKAPDDTYPAFTPNYYLGGFTCFDCHSPHANPARILGFGWDGTAILGDSTVDETDTVVGIANPGHEFDDSETGIMSADLPVWVPGSWLLIKNPDVEILDDAEVTDMDTALHVFYDVDGDSNDDSYPVNKFATDWNTPIGLDADPNPLESEPDTITAEAFSVSEFCADCHDGNAGMHDVAAPLFSEDRALRDQGDSSDDPEWRGNYDIAYGHDAQPRSCVKQMVFNPEDGLDYGPNCRKCHKGGSDCVACHSTTGYSRGYLGAGDGFRKATPMVGEDEADAIDNDYENDGGSGITMLDVTYISGIDTETIANAVMDVDDDEQYSTDGDGIFKWERTVVYPQDWRTMDEKLGDVGDPDDFAGSSVGFLCSNDGFSWPHRTLGWMMLKDDLFGVDFDGDPVAVGATRMSATAIASSVDLYNDVTVFGDNDDVEELTVDGFQDFVSHSSLTNPAHDLDSVCLDCHNPTIWNAVTAGNMGPDGENHVDHTGTAVDDYNDELILRGLP